MEIYLMLWVLFGIAGACCITINDHMVSYYREESHNGSSFSYVIMVIFILATGVLGFLAAFDSVISNYYFFKKKKNG